MCILILAELVPLLQHSKSGHEGGTGGKRAATSTEVDGSLLEFLRLLARLAVYIHRHTDAHTHTIFTCFSNIPITIPISHLNSHHIGTLNSRAITPKQSCFIFLPFSLTEGDMRFTLLKLPDPNIPSERTIPVSHLTLPYFNGHRHALSSYSISLSLTHTPRM